MAAERFPDRSLDVLNIVMKDYRMLAKGQGVTLVASSVDAPSSGAAGPTGTALLQEQHAYNGKEDWKFVARNKFPFLKRLPLSGPARGREAAYGIIRSTDV